jgi:predicted dehydrogenase
MSESLSRRQMLKSTVTLAAASIVPGRVLGLNGGTAPSEQVALAGIGVGGVGNGQIRSLVEAGFRVVALCDVDDVYAKKTYDEYADVKTYRDFREMLETEDKRIDAVYCGTPDHTHAVIAQAALRAKKHICCVKPLTRTISEGRILAKEAKISGVRTQMTASSAVSEEACATRELISAGAIGDVTEVYIWSNRPLWPQGMLSPKGEDPVPDTLDWNLWLGPARKRPFKDTWPEGHYAIEQKPRNNRKDGVYHPWNFRGWYDFGTGALGDMGCHYFNVPRIALKLGYPETVSASCTKLMGETWPLASIVTYDFPARQGMPPLRLIWYDGGLKAPRPAELEAGRSMPQSGVLYIGTKGKILDGRVIPESRMEKLKLPPRTLKRWDSNWQEWFASIQTGERTSQAWETCAVPLSEMVLLGNIAIRTGQDLKWDGSNMKFTNSEDANTLLQHNYQNGWSLS